MCCVTQLSQSMVFIAIVVVYSLLTSLPWSVYSTFILEDRHGFNQQVS